MSDLFAGVYGARFPDVVLNSGPLPPSGGLPAPLHDTPDARINYSSTLLGDLQPYAYGEPGYLSSQSAYLNIPHRIQKFIPVLHLPEPAGTECFRLSHAVDDSDLAFVMRLNRNSIFCTGTRFQSNRNGLTNAIDPLINLPTLNYLLAGLQVAMPIVPDQKNLWCELLYNLDPRKWSKTRNYSQDQDDTGIFEHDPLCLTDLVHLVRNCIRPFGVVRGSEKQGGQDEVGNSPATWPVPAICTLVIDGKEANVVNIWHKHNVQAGSDLVLRFQLMPLRRYTLNHYYKGFVRKTFERAPEGTMVWQLVPDVLEMEEGEPLTGFDRLPAARRRCLAELRSYLVPPPRMPLATVNLYKSVKHRSIKIGEYCMPWQEIGYWHIGRSQVMVGAYGIDEYYNDDMANMLKTNHLEMTFQPVFECMSRPVLGGRYTPPAQLVPRQKIVSQPIWRPSLHLERLGQKRAPPELEEPAPKRPWAELAPPPRVELAPPVSLAQEPALDPPRTVRFVDELAVPGFEPPKAKRRGKKEIAGTILKPDGGSESTPLQML